MRGPGVPTSASAERAKREDRPSLRDLAQDTDHAPIWHTGLPPPHLWNPGAHAKRAADHRLAPAQTTSFAERWQSG